jgi:hypothetical protein
MSIPVEELAEHLEKGNVRPTDDATKASGTEFVPCMWATTLLLVIMLAVLLGLFLPCPHNVLRGCEDAPPRQKVSEHRGKCRARSDTSSLLLQEPSETLNTPAGYITSTTEVWAEFSTQNAGQAQGTADGTRYTTVIRTNSVSSTEIHINIDVTHMEQLSRLEDGSVKSVTMLNASNGEIVTYQAVLNRMTEEVTDLLKPAENHKAVTDTVFIHIQQAFPKLQASPEGQLKSRRLLASPDETLPEHVANGIANVERTVSTDPTSGETKAKQSYQHTVEAETDSFIEFENPANNSMEAKFEQETKFDAKHDISESNMSTTMSTSKMHQLSNPNATSFMSDQNISIISKMSVNASGTDEAGLRASNARVGNQTYVSVKNTDEGKTNTRRLQSNRLDFAVQNSDSDVFYQSLYTGPETWIDMPTSTSTSPEFEYDGSADPRGDGSSPMDNDNSPLANPYFAANDSYIKGQERKRKLCSPPRKSQSPPPTTGDYFKAKNYPKDAIESSVTLAQFSALGKPIEVGAEIFAGSATTVAQAKLITLRQKQAVILVRRTKQNDEGLVLGTINFCDSGSCEQVGYSGELAEWKAPARKPTNTRIPTGNYDGTLVNKHQSCGATRNCCGASNKCSKHDVDMISIRTPGCKEWGRVSHASSCDRTGILIHLGGKIKDWSTGCVLIGDTVDVSDGRVGTAGGGADGKAHYRAKMARLAALVKASYAARGYEPYASEATFLRVIVTDATNGDVFGGVKGWANSLQLFKETFDPKGRRSLSDGRRKLAEGSITLIPPFCMPSPIFVIMMCCNLVLDYAYGAPFTTKTNGLSFEMSYNPHLKAGFTASFAFNVWFAEVGVYARGTPVNYALPAQIAFQVAPKPSFCAKWDAQSFGVSLEGGVYYRMIQCRFRWCCSVRCSLSGSRNIGSPIGFSFGPSSYRLLTIGDSSC